MVCRHHLLGSGWLGRTTGTSHPWNFNSSTSSARVRASRHGPANAHGLRAGRALGLRTDRARRNTRRGVAKELGAEPVQIGDRHASVVRVIGGRLIEERLADEEVLTEAVQI